MKTVILLSVLFLSAALQAQPPQKFNFQKVIRSSNNQLVVNTPVGIKISIIKKDAGDSILYSETHYTVTNANGLATLIVGDGNRLPEYSAFELINWESGNYVLSTDIDPAGGTHYLISDTIKFGSTPYALHAKTAEILTGALPETDPAFNTSAASAIIKSDTTTWNSKQPLLVAGKGIKITGNIISIDEKYFSGDTTKAVDQLGEGIALKYPGDVGIENDESVIFTEQFEAETLSAILPNWTWSNGANDHRLSLDTIPGPDGTPGEKCLKMTILNGIGGAGSDLRKIFDEGYEQLFLRFYVKFAEDYGFNHHFTSLSGAIDPTPWPVGSAGQKPTESFSSTIDQLPQNLNLTGPDTTPPGYWMFYSYWPEMHSWQTLEGASDGRPDAWYGNNFMPNQPVPVKRGEWQCVEIMIRLNSSPDLADGAHAFWINGELAGHWDPKEKNPVEGFWIRDRWRHDPTNASARPFPGFRWRTIEDPERFDKLKINILRLQNYVSDTSWDTMEKYSQNNPGFNINLREATVWKDHVVVATEYIGPMVPKK